MAKKRAQKKTTGRTSSRGSRGKPKDLQKTIKDMGFSWEASTEPVEHGLGLKFVDKELKQLEETIAGANRVEAIASSFAAPIKVDWRDNNGNWVTSVKNQESCGSCVSFATCATIESRIQIVCRNAAMNPDLSEANLFFCGCGNCCNSGWFFTNALDYAKDKGIGLERDFPYTPNDQPCRNITPFIKINEWRRVLSMSERKSVLNERGPMVAGIKVYADFQSYRSGIYRRTQGSPFRGNHAITVVGYSDQENCWIIKNSWGPGWGESGYCQIAYGEIGIDTTYPFYDVSLTCPTPPVDDLCRRYLPFLRQVLVMSRQDRRLHACLRYYVCRRGSRVLLRQPRNPHRAACYHDPATLSAVSRTVLPRWGKPQDHFFRNNCLK